MIRKEWKLKEESELRCEVGESDPLFVKLLKGNAEIYGVEMALEKEYAFLDENLAIYSWYGCVIETVGNCEALYLSDSTPMTSYVNTHIQLEARRDVALGNQIDGPRVLIVGPSDHGKSTTAKILLSYAARLDRNPIFVDLDVGQSYITIPGCISAVPVDKTCLCIEDGFTGVNPLVYFHGHNSPKENVDLYKLLVSTLAQKIRGRFDRDIDARASGIIVNTSGWIDGPGFDVILHCVNALEIDVVLVMSHDRLHSSLTAALGEHVTVVKLAHSGGVVQREPNARRRARKSKIRQYFYGRYKFPTVLSKMGSSANMTSFPTVTVQSLSSTYFPSRQSMKLSSVQFYRAGGLQLSDALRLIGETTTAQDNTQLVRINATVDLVNSIVAVIHPPDEGLDENSSSVPSGNGGGGFSSQGPCNTAGFLCIVQLDPETDTLTVLSPCPGTLPSRQLLVGSLKWVE